MEEVYNAETEKSRIALMREKQAGLNTPEKISKLEKEPAYLRRGVNLDQCKNEKEEAKMSNWTVKENTGRIELVTDNAYLHDNVD